MHRVLKELARPFKRLKRRVIRPEIYDGLRACKKGAARLLGRGDAGTGEQVSIILPDHHRTELLRRAMLSVIGQPYTNYELLVVLDGPEPGTREAALEFRDNPKVRIFEIKENTGNASLPRNVGIAEASYPLVTFLDSDDLLHPNKLSVLAGMMGDADVVYGNSLIDNNGRRYASETVKVDMDRLLRKNYIPTTTAVVRREPLMELGGFKPKMRYMEDYELWARLMYHGCRFRYVKGIFGVYNLHDGNLEPSFAGESDRWKETLLEEYRLVPEAMALPDYEALE